MAKQKTPTLPIDRPGNGEDFGAFIRRHYGSHPGQVAFLTSTAKWRCVVAGIGGGKTELGAFEVLRNIVGRPGITVAGASPTYRMLDRSMKPALRKVLSWWPHLPYEEHKSDQTFTFPTKRGPDGQPSQIIFCHGGDPDAIRAFDAGLVWLDEAPLCKEDVFRTLLGRLRQPGTPKRGILTGTPKGMNYVYRHFVRERDTWDAERQRDYEFFTWPSYQNPLYAAEPEYIKDLKTVYVEGSDWYRQEVEASFIALRGLVYAMFDELEHCQPAPPNDAFRKTAYGVDWGTTSPGCILVLKQHRDKTWWLVDEVYERGKLIHTGKGGDWVAEAKALIQQHGPGVFYCDPNGADPIATFQMNGIAAVAANNKRMDGVHAVQGMLPYRFRVVQDAAPNTVAEFLQYHWPEDRDGNPIEDAQAGPAKEFDHAMDALRYVVMGVHGMGETDGKKIEEIPGGLAAGLQRVL